MGLLQLREGLFAALVIPGAARWRHTPQLTYKQPERVELVVVVVVVCGQHGLGLVCSSVTILTPPHHHLAPPPPASPQHSTAQQSIALAQYQLGVYILRRSSPQCASLQYWAMGMDLRCWPV